MDMKKRWNPAADINRVSDSLREVVMIGVVVLHILYQLLCH